LTKILIIILFLWSNFAWAATYYVDNSCTDTNPASHIVDGTTYDPATPACTGGSDSYYTTLADLSTSEETTGPGDFILLRSGKSWRETLSIPESGTSGNVITYGRFGTGAAPKILMTEQVDGDPYTWVEYDGTHKIYSVDLTATGATKFYTMANEAGTDREPRYISLPAAEDWADGYTWGSIYDATPTFYYRSTTVGSAANLNAQNREVGVRDYGINFGGYDYITVDGIEIYGPGGTDAADWADKNIRGFSGANAYNLTIKNCKTSMVFSNWLTGQNGTASNTVIERNTFEKAWAGVQFYYYDGATVKHNTFINICNKGGDTGDCPFFGVQYSDDGVFFNNYCNDRGYAGNTSNICDNGISIVNGSDGWTISSNYIGTSVIGGIIYGSAGEEGDPSGITVIKNVIENWGVSDYTPSGLLAKTPDKDFCAIKTCGGGGSYVDCGDTVIEDNLIINHAADAEDNHYSAGILVERNHDSLKVNRNYIWNISSAVYDIQYRIGSVAGTHEFDDNYLSGSDDTIYQGTTPYTYEEWNTEKNYANNNGYLTEQPCGPYWIGFQCRRGLIE